MERKPVALVVVALLVNGLLGCGLFGSGITAIVFHIEGGAIARNVHHTKRRVVHHITISRLKRWCGNNFSNGVFAHFFLQYFKRTNHEFASRTIFGHRHNIVVRIYGKHIGWTFRVREIHACAALESRSGSFGHFKLRLRGIPVCATNGVNLHWLGANEEIVLRIHGLRAMEIGRNECVEHLWCRGVHHSHRHLVGFKFQIFLAFQHTAHIFQLSAHEVVFLERVQRLWQVNQHPVALVVSHRIGHQMLRFDIVDLPFTHHILASIACGVFRIDGATVSRHARTGERAVANAVIMIHVQT